MRVTIEQMLSVTSSNEIWFSPPDQNVSLNR